MVRRLMFSKYSVIFTWLMSYVLILFISIFIGVITFGTTIKVVENEVSQTNNLLLKHSQQNIDKVIKEAQDLSTEISLNANIQDILSYYTPLSSSDYYNISRATKNLIVYKNTYRSVDDFYIYFNKIDMALSPSGASDEQTFYEAYYKDTGVPYDKWHEINGQKYSGNYILLDGNDGKRKMVLYARSLPILENKFISATVFIKLNESKFIENVGQIGDIDGAAAFIIDKDNNIISSTGNIGSAEKISYSEISKDNGSFHKTIKGKEVTVSYTTSENRNWKYVTLMPSSFFWSEVQYVKRYSAISILLCILIGGIAAAIMVKKNYNPVQRLVREFEKQAMPTGIRNKNEYSFIQDTLTGIITREMQMGVKLEQQNEALRSAFLARLFKGDFKETSYINEYISSLNFSFLTEYFSVFILYINDIEEGNFQNKVNLINNVLKEVLNKEFRVYITEVDGMITGIINYKHEPLNMEINDTMNSIRKVQDIANNEYKVLILVTVSNIHKGVENSEKAFYEAVQAMEYAKIMGIDSNLCFADMNKYSGNKSSYSLDKAEHLINFIKAGDTENSEKILSEILGSQSVHQKINKGLKMNLISMLVTIINDTTMNQDKYCNLLCKTEQLIKMNSAQELKEKILDIINAISNNLQKNNDNSLKLKDKIIKYINENCSNPDINITSIAEYFNMHPVYISQVFRDQTGEGILDYIHRNRIKIAKKLLIAPEYTLEMVAKEAGYLNIRTFIRTFKKYEGINPGSYKDNCKTYGIS